MIPILNIDGTASCSNAALKNNAGIYHTYSAWDNATMFSFNTVYVGSLQ